MISGAQSMDLLPIAGARVAQILKIEGLVGLPPPSSPGFDRADRRSAILVDPSWSGAWTSLSSPYVPAINVF